MPSDPFVVINDVMMTFLLSLKVIGVLFWQSHPNVSVFLALQKKLMEFRFC